MDLTHGYQAETHVLPGYLSDIASEEKQTINQPSHREVPYDLSEVPDHALDGDCGIPLSSKESRFVWLAIVVGQIILGLTIYAIL